MSSARLTGSLIKMAYTSFLKISGVETAVGCWGMWVEEPEPDEVIICITGNPGVTSFYYPYLEELHQLTKKPTWVIGHAGHEEPEVTNSTFLKKVGPIAGREDLFNLEGQYLHKVEFIEKYTSPTTKIHLLGHSVGAWIALEMLKDSRVKNRIKSVQLLFPTIQRMADTPNGKFFNKIVRPVMPFLMMVLWFLNKTTPMCFYNVAIKCYCFFKGYDSQFHDTLVKYIYSSYTVAEKNLFMAFDELDRIKDLDSRTLCLNSNKITMVYNEKDDWAPGWLFDEIRVFFPVDRIHKVNYSHAFVLKNSSEMADLSAKLIRSGVFKSGSD